MSLFLSSSPAWLSFFLVVVIPTALTVGGMILARRLVGLERLATYNEVAGFKFAVVGVTYAVLLGFAVIVVWEKFRDAETTVAQEASAIVAIHRVSQGLGEQAGNDVRTHLVAYLKAVIADDWPIMARGKVGRQAGAALDGLYASVLAEGVATRRDSVIMGEMLADLRSVTQARRERLLLATGIVPGVLWMVLIAGAVVTLSYAFFFGLPSIPAQALMTGQLAVVIFMALFLAVEIDHPFTGPVSVGTEAYQLALERLVAR